MSVHDVTLLAERTPRSSEPCRTVLGVSGLVEALYELADQVAALHPDLR